MSKNFIVILPTGKRHELSPFLFEYYCELGLLRIQRSKPSQARVAKWLRAWPSPSGALRFEAVTPEAVVMYPLDAVERLWRRLLAMAPITDESKREQVYSAVTEIGLA